MSIEKTFQGAWRVSEVVNGILVSRQYFGHTKREAMRAFRAEVKALAD